MFVYGLATSREVRFKCRFLEHATGDPLVLVCTCRGVDAQYYPSLWRCATDARCVMDSVLTGPVFMCSVVRSANADAPLDIHWSRARSGLAQRHGLRSIVGVAQSRGLSALLCSLPEGFVLGPLLVCPAVLVWAYVCLLCSAV